MQSQYDKLTPNFYRHEFEEDGYDIRIDPRIPVICQAIRDRIGKPLYITSGVRSASHNKAVGGSPKSSHLRGLACDITTVGRGQEMGARDRMLIVNALLESGVCRIGIAKTFIHFDLDEQKDQEVIWLY